MSYSYIEYTASGGSTFNIPFGYIEQSEINVYVDGVTATFTFTTPSTVNVSPTPTTGSLVRVERTTDLTNRVVDFASGSVLTEEDMDNSNIQVFNAAQEAIDKANDSIGLGVDGKYDASAGGTNRVIKNVADPVDANDAVNKSWAESGMTSQLTIATGQATSATASAAAALASQTAAATSATNAASSASAANTSATNAANSATAAAASETAAAASQAAASASQSAAATSASNASTSATSASTSSTNATAQASAAANSATNAAASEANALTSKNAAATSATSAASSASSAATSATSAGNSATNAQTSATNAANSATSAGTSATSALSSKNAAATSETNAAASATAAAASATAAATSETNAAASAASAAAALDNFDDRYLGAKAADPATDNDGNALITGALYFNTTAGVMKIYTASGWIAASSASVATMNKFKFTATASQTSFTGADDDGNTLSITVGAEIVTLNGIVLEAGTDYTPASGSITLATGAAASDELNVFAFGNFTIAATVERVDGTTGAAQIPVGGTGARPTAATGLFRFNSDLNTFEGYNGSSWGSVGGGATGSAGEQIFYLNEQQVDNSYTIPTGYNAGSFGSVTLATGVSVTIPTGSSWTIVI